MRSLRRTAKAAAKEALRRAVATWGASARALEPAQWGLTVDRRDGLCVEGAPLHDLLTRFGSPLHVVLANKLRANAAAFGKKPAGAAHAPLPFYSYKTNPVPGVLSIIHEEGVGAEVISEYELWLACRLGVRPEQIVFNGPGKSDAGIRHAIELGIRCLNLNHREEAARVERIARELGKKVRIGLRIDVGSGWSAQFGIPLTGGHALEAYRAALTSPWFDVVGLHVHRGFTIHADGDLEFVDAALNFAATLRQELDLELEILNLGGSLGTPTVRGLTATEQRLNQTLQRDLQAPDPAQSFDIDGYIAAVVERVEDFYMARGWKVPSIFLEPGRALTGNTQLLLTSVISTKSASDTTFAIMDAGINHAESVRSEYHQLLSVNRPTETATRRFTVVGPICSPGDTLYRSVLLPPLVAGDSLAIMDAGAYFVPFATSFSFPQPAIVLADAGQFSLLRRAENFDDLVLHDAIPAAGKPSP